MLSRYIRSNPYYSLFKVHLPRYSMISRASTNGAESNDSSENPKTGASKKGKVINTANRAAKNFDNIWNNIERAGPAIDLLHEFRNTMADIVKEMAGTIRRLGPDLQEIYDDIPQMKQLIEENAQMLRKYLIRFTLVFFFVSGGFSYLLAKYENEIVEALEKTTGKLLVAIDNIIERTKSETVKAIHGQLEVLVKNIAKPTEIRKTIAQVEREFQRLQFKYSNSISGLYIMHFVSRGYSHQYKMRALFALKQELEKLEQDGKDTFTSEDISNKAVSLLQAAYSFDQFPEQEDLDFKESLPAKQNIFKMTSKR